MTRRTNPLRAFGRSLALGISWILACGQVAHARDNGQPQAPAKAADASPAREIELSVWMPTASAVNILRGVATDRTPDVIPSKESEPPTNGIFWEMKDFDLVIAIYSDDETRKISRLEYWSKSEFKRPESRKSWAAKGACGITLDAEHRSFRVRNYFPDGSIIGFAQCWYGGQLAAMKEPILSAAGKGNDYFAYRVVCLPSFHHAVAVRYEKKGDRFVRRQVMLSARAATILARSRSRAKSKFPRGRSTTS